MDKNGLNIIKAVFLIITIGLLSIISILQTNNKDNISSAVTPQPAPPTYKNPTKSTNPNIEYYNTIAGSGDEDLYKVITKDNYYVIGSTRSHDGDFCNNTKDSIFVSKINKSGTILKTITIPYQSYFDSIQYKDYIVITYNNTDNANYIAYITFDLSLTTQKTQDGYDKLYIADNILYGYNTLSSKLYNIIDNTYYCIGYNNYVMDNIMINNGELVLFLWQNSFVIVKINQGKNNLILELEDISFVNSQYMQEDCFVSVVIDNQLLINKIDYKGNIIFCYEDDFDSPKRVDIITQPNGYDIYISDSNTTQKIFLCNHGDNIYSENLDLANIKYISNDNNNTIIVASTLSNNTVIKTATYDYIINGGEINNVYYDSVLNILFCKSSANNLDLIGSGFCDIYMFKLNTKQ